MNRRPETIAILIPATVIMIIVFLLAFIKCAKAECIQHEVKKGESLKSVAYDHYGHKKYWIDIKYQNELKRNRLKPGQVLYLFVPEEDEWFSACGNIVLRRLTEKEYLGQLNNVTKSIINGIERAQDLLELDVLEKMEFCRYALATWEQESMYEDFAVGAVGEISCYQFRLETARLTLEVYSLDWKDDSDKALVGFLLDSENATWLFTLHFQYLLKRYKTLGLAWLRYNGYGEHAQIYAQRILSKYRQIRKIQPMYCKKGS